MNNRFLSPIYLYIKSEIKSLGVKNIGKSNIQSAYDAVDLLITSCCTLGFPSTKSMFLNNVYNLLKTINLPTDLRKLKEVKKLLTPYINNTCC